MIISTGVNLKLVAIIDRGDIKKERVHLEVTSDGDITYYILLATQQLGPNLISAGARNAYWFEPTDVKTGDHVIVYTKGGAYSRSVRKDGYNNHFFYWGRTTALFGNGLARVVVAQLNVWETGG